MSPPDQSPDYRPGRVLVADDDRDSRYLASRVLSTHGHQVTEVEDGEAALAAIQTDLPDVIVLDGMMPGLDGFEVCRRLKADPRTAPVPVILLTALTHALDRISGREAGADHFLVKPLVTQDLVFAVRNAIHTRRLFLSAACRCETLQTQVVSAVRDIRHLLHEPGAGFQALAATLEQLRSPTDGTPAGAISLETALGQVESLRQDLERILAESEATLSRPPADSVSGSPGIGMLRRR